MTPPKLQSWYIAQGIKSLWMPLRVTLIWNRVFWETWNETVRYLE